MNITQHKERKKKQDEDEKRKKIIKIADHEP